MAAITFRRLCAEFLDRSNIIVTAVVSLFVLWTKSSGAAYFAACSLACAVVAKVIKRIVRQARPPAESALRAKKSFGCQCAPGSMPSTHSAVVSFQAAYVILACLNMPIHPSIPLQESQRLLPIVVIVPWAIAIMVSRVRLGYHTWTQVLAGFTTGVPFAAIAYDLWNRGVNDYAFAVEQFVKPYLTRVWAKRPRSGPSLGMLTRYHCRTPDAIRTATSTTTMDSDNDPIHQFFPGEEDVDLYAVLNLTNDATQDMIKKAYRRMALVYHPDKHASATEQAKADASTKFQQIGFAYAVLSDEKRKERYDKTGKTDEGFDLGVGDDGWEAYFEELFERVTRGKLDEDKKQYQGSAEEIEDLKNAYNEVGGSIAEIMSHIPHSTYEDEARFVLTISSLIVKGELESTPEWQKSVKDEKAKLARKKEGEREAKEAEKLAKELGVWDEFFGDGKPTKRHKKDKDKGGDEEEDVSALQALILKKREKNMDSFFDGLAAKYGAAPTRGKGKGKKRANPDDEDAEELDIPSKKKSRSAVPPPPEISEEEFAKLQAKVVGDKKSKGASSKPNSKSKSGKARKTK
ncbi:DnaJ domain-containing protein [Coprinopsis cinerea okayama7|uniref:DnaJ domain-containing protein n=1 Tax=Coprinopsis cinerea (strain Okayama-7 / 130 / ATCC MYA-4618 / FGSC 9003) TaxID=240176 RepID=A8NFG8_COPC7|nr:DnaJ domain-containing protein [Coprinopsis cinerea okayama7\|eukprot:XP_001833280.2 DnaJ domain-containing protein [Coprinopsis cinerea okayama7\